MSEFTKRQSSLFKRLQRVCDKIDQIILPVKITKVEIFGSTIRGKSNPKDLDIIIRYDKDEVLWSTYETLCDVFHHMKHYQHATPKEAVLDYLKQFKKDDTKLREIYSIWLEGFSWNNMYLGTIGFNELIKKILLNGTKEIHIADIREINDSIHMKTRTIENVWEKSKPDVVSNMKKILSEPKLRKNLVEELDSIEIQIKEFRESLQIVVKAIELTLNHKIDDLIKKIHFAFPHYDVEWIKDVLHDDDLSDVKFDFQVDTNMFHTFSTNQLQDAVETKRSNLKKLKKMNLVYRRTLFYLEQWHNLEHPKIWTRDSWVCSRVLGDIPKKEVSETDIRNMLQEIGLDEKETLSDRTTGRVQYMPKEQ